MSILRAQLLVVSIKPTFFQALLSWRLAQLFVCLHHKLDVTTSHELGRVAFKILVSPQ